MASSWVATTKPFGSDSTKNTDFWARGWPPDVRVAVAPLATPGVIWAGAANTSWVAVLPIWKPSTVEVGESWKSPAKEAVRS